ncbi:MAG TPA: hypothetical protein VHZ03_02200 [Trebonia sp.]|nr:hypothetical protein [Trebonia sp.]
MYADDVGPQAQVDGGELLDLETSQILLDVLSELGGVVGREPAAGGAASRSRGGPVAPGPGSCMAPKPTRHTVTEPREYEDM